MPFCRPPLDLRRRVFGVFRRRPFSSSSAELSFSSAAFAASTLALSLLTTTRTSRVSGGRELGRLGGFVVVLDFALARRRRFFGDLFLDLGAEHLQLHPGVDVRLGEVRFFEEFLVLGFGFEVLFFDFFEFVGDFLVGDRDAQFFGLALDPDRVEQFAQRRFLQFVVFVRRPVSALFSARLRAACWSSARLNSVFGDRCRCRSGTSSTIGDVAGGDARIADALGDREADEEHDEEGAEDEQRQAAARPAGLAPLPGALLRSAPTKWAA